MREAVVASVTQNRVEFALGDTVVAHTAVPITLFLAIFKFDRMEWAIEKCTELNVTSMVPVIARRTEKHLALAAEKRMDRWRRIAREAAEQSRRVAQPEIANPQSLKAVLAGGRSGAEIGDNADNGLRIVLAESERELMLNEILHANAPIESLTLATGPEGGWTDDELRSFEAADWVKASLGETILRAETAAVAALALARAAV